METEKATVEVDNKDVTEIENATMAMTTKKSQRLKRY